MALDKLKLISGEPIDLGDGLILKQPTLHEIKEFGEDRYLNTFMTLCAAPWDCPALLYDLGIDFMKISEWEFFRCLMSIVDLEGTDIIFDGVDLARLEAMTRMKDEDGTDVVLYDPVTEFVMDEEVYHEFIPYLREMIGFVHTGRKAKDVATKIVLIQDDRKRRARQTDKKDDNSMMFDMIVSLVNTEEFQYDYKTVFDLTIYQLTKSLIQIQGKKSAMALLQGSMSGFCDTSGIKSTDMSWLYSEEKYKPKPKKLVNNIYK